MSKALSPPPAKKPKLTWQYVADCVNRPSAENIQHYQTIVQRLVDAAKTVPTYKDGDVKNNLLVLVVLPDELTMFSDLCNQPKDAEGDFECVPAYLVRAANDDDVERAMLDGLRDATSKWRYHDTEKHGARCVKVFVQHASRAGGLGLLYNMQASGFALDHVLGYPSWDRTESVVNTSSEQLGDWAAEELLALRRTYNRTNGLGTTMWDMSDEDRLSLSRLMETWGASTTSRELAIRRSLPLVGGASFSYSDLTLASSFPGFNWDRLVKEPDLSKICCSWVQNGF